MAIPAVANIVMNVILLPRIGLMGAVYATVASYVLAFVLLAVAGRKLARLSWPWLDFARVAGSCATMAIAVRLLPSPGGFPELLIKASAGAAVYAVAALAFDAAGARAALREFLARRVRQA
jgi:O-antigen/teichoic acid export membrane protein